MGNPLHYRNLRREDIRSEVDRIIVNIAGPLGRNMSYRGKLFFLNNFIATIRAYLMAMIKFPKRASNDITSQMPHFSWDNLGDVHKYHLANWGLMSKKTFLVVWVFLILGIITLPCWLPR